MITSLTIDNFRGFKKLTMSKLARVNLITGKSNTGKTALLEAIYLCFSKLQDQQHRHFPALFRSSFERAAQANFWGWMCYNSNVKEEAKIMMQMSDGLSRAVYLRHPSKSRKLTEHPVLQFPNLSIFQEPSPRKENSTLQKITAFSTHPSSPDEDAKDYVMAAKKRDGEERLESLLREIEPRLKKVRAFQVEESNASLIYADVGLRDLIPVSQLGQGFNRLLRIYSALIATGSQICLIDEIENGLHHSVLREVWKGLAAVARQEDVQIFATTHSWECVVAAHEVFREMEPYDLALHRLERVKGEIEAISYEQGTLDAAEELQLEVR